MESLFRTVEFQIERPKQLYIWRTYSCVQLHYNNRALTLTPYKTYCNWGFLRTGMVVYSYGEYKNFEFDTLLHLPTYTSTTAASPLFNSSATVIAT